MARRKDNTGLLLVGGAALLGGMVLLIGTGGATVFFLTRRRNQPTTGTAIQYAVASTSKTGSVSPAVFTGKPLITTSGTSRPGYSNWTGQFANAGQGQGWYDDGKPTKADKQKAAAMAALKGGLAVTGAAAGGPFGAAIGGVIGKFLDIF